MIAIAAAVDGPGCQQRRAFGPPSNRAYGAPLAHNWLRISPLHEAARKGDVREARKLLESGADLTARDEHLRSTPLAWAAKYGQLEIVKFLLQRGAPKSLPDDPSWATPLAWAIRRGHDNIARLLS